MAELKYGGSDVKKLMFRDIEIGGSQKLESGTPLAFLEPTNMPISTPLHLFSSGSSWENLEKINVQIGQRGTNPFINYSFITTSVLNISEIKKGSASMSYTASGFTSSWNFNGVVSDDGSLALIISGDLTAYYKNSSRSINFYITVA